jgi:FAD/FMN-containing dehydrogenase
MPADTSHRLEPAAPALPGGFSARVREALGPEAVSEDQADFAAKLADWRGRSIGHSPLLVRPADTAQVSALMKLCHAANVAVTPQGGNTGLVNGGIPYGEVLVAMDRLRAIRQIDAENNSLVVEAGTPLVTVQAAADANRRLFPLSLGSEGTATIGGLLSTNAGGVAVLRYGMMRDLVLGLEVVLADGSVLNSLRGLRKDNTGYDLKHLFIGAEGTLGLITAACLKLFPAVAKSTAWVCLNSVEQAVALLHKVRERAGDTVTSFELMPANAVAMVVAESSTARDPMASSAPWRVLVEISSGREADAVQALEESLAAAAEAGLIEDAVVASSLSQTRSFWHIRETIPMVKRAFRSAVNHDVSVPVSRVAAFLTAADAASRRVLPHAEIFAFGHLGDGNIHYGVADPTGSGPALTGAGADAITRAVHDIVSDMGGSISAEHGIGLLKRDELAMRKAGPEMELMRAIKRTLDPKGILNPGRVVSV